MYTQAPQPALMRVKRIAREFASPERILSGSRLPVVLRHCHVGNSPQPRVQAAAALAAPCAGSGLATRRCPCSVRTIMPQDSVQQAIVRGALARFPQTISGGDMSDHTLTLSGLEIAQIRAVLEEFIRLPAEPTPGDNPASGQR